MAKKTNTNKSAITNAFALIGKPVDNKAKESFVLPTARVRKAIDFLSNTTPQEIADKETPLRPLLQDLFNWDGKNHVNKPLIRAFEQAINTPMKYPQAVELTGFLAALAPLLEADQIARMYGLINKVSTAFAPAKYTIQLNGLLEQVFKDFSLERRERLASSLWEESHQGRWWNISAGIEDNGDNGDIQYEPRSAEKIFEGIKNTFNATRFIHLEGVDWNPHYQKVFSHIKPSPEIAKLAEEYKEKLEVGEYVHPDIAVYLSGLSWLAPWQRSESPIGGLLKTLIGILEEIEEKPKTKKPRKFSDLFPEIYLQAGAQNAFPMFDPVRRLDGKDVEGHTLKLIKNRVSLADNAKYMGNCTLGYENRMKEGEYALFFIDTGEIQYNISITLNTKTGTWGIGEINTRYNRTQEVSVDFRRKIAEIVRNIPSATDDYKNYLDMVKNNPNGTNKNFTYSLY